MSESVKQKSAYDMLSPQKKQLVDMVLENLESGAGLWKQGWRPRGAPVSGMTGKPYRGNNNLYLTYVTMRRGYRDNRWYTHNQMAQQDWHFKRDEEGNTLGKGAGVTIEFYELYDRATKKKYDPAVLDGMTEDEKADYERENVYPLRRSYHVFNADLIEGVPEREVLNVPEGAQNARAEKLLEYWNEHESKIEYGGSEASYNRITDTIRLPERGDFNCLEEFYSAAFHETGHSTGHETRLNRMFGEKFGDDAYAREELCAEFASLFIEQDLEISVDASHIRNNSAYIGHWYERIKEDPNVLFTAIADANKISKYIADKERGLTKGETEPYTIAEEQDEYGDSVYKVYMIAGNGQTAAALGGYPFKSRDALLSEFQKMRELPYWSDKGFKEVGMDELRAASALRAEQGTVQEEKSDVYIKPSEAAARATFARVATDMTGRGVESLTRMSDREVVERAGRTKNGEKFSALYNGLPVLENEEKDERSLMSRLAMFCDGDKAKLLRVFKSSGQYRDGKPNSFYEKMAEQSLQFIAKLKTSPLPSQPTRRANYGANAK